MSLYDYSSEDREDLDIVDEIADSIWEPGSVFDDELDSEPEPEPDVYQPTLRQLMEHYAYEERALMDPDFCKFI